MSSAQELTSRPTFWVSQENMLSPLLAKNAVLPAEMSCVHNWSQQAPFQLDKGQASAHDMLYKAKTLHCAWLGTQQACWMTTTPDILPCLSQIPLPQQEFCRQLSFSDRTSPPKKRPRHCAADLWMSWQLEPETAVYQPNGGLIRPRRLFTEQPHVRLTWCLFWSLIRLCLTRICS